MARTRRHNQIVICKLTVRQLHHFARQIEILHLRHQHFDVAAVAENPANGGSDLARRQSCGRNLVKQRLKSMKVLAIDERNLYRISRQRLSGHQPAKSASNDDHPRTVFLLHNLYYIRFRKPSAVSKTLGADN